MKGAKASRRRTAVALDGRELASADLTLMRDLIRRARDIDAHYRAAAQQIGELYLQADLQRLGGLTRFLDEPMRQASDVQRSFDRLVSELQALAPTLATRRPTPTRRAIR